MLILCAHACTLFLTLGSLSRNIQYYASSPDVCSCILQLSPLPSAKAAHFEQRERFFTAALAVLENDIAGGHALVVTPGSPGLQPCLQAEGWRCPTWWLTEWVAVIRVGRDRWGPGGRVLSRTEGRDPAHLLAGSQSPVGTAGSQG